MIFLRISLGLQNLKRKGEYYFTVTTLQLELELWGNKKPPVSVSLLLDRDRASASVMSYKPTNSAFISLFLFQNVSESKNSFFISIINCFRNTGSKSHNQIWGHVGIKKIFHVFMIYFRVIPISLEFFR